MIERNCPLMGGGKHGGERARGVSPVAVRSED